MRKIFNFGFVFLSLVSMSSQCVFAANVNIDGGGAAQNINIDGGGLGIGTIENPLKAPDITTFLLDVIHVILVFAKPIVVLYIMYAGYLFVVARGAPSEIETARTALLYAVIGGVIIFGADLIVEIIKNTVEQITNQP